MSGGPVSPESGPLGHGSVLLMLGSCFLCLFMKHELKMQIRVSLVLVLVLITVCGPGDGTMLLVASKVLNKDKPVVGVNTDPER